MTNDVQLGWIKLYRKLLGSPIFSSEKGLKIWVWCLLKATHEGFSQYVGRSLIELQPGQFIFGRKVAAGELRMKQSTVRDWINQLKSDRYIDINSNSKYSVISIINWKEYQSADIKPDNNPTTNQQQTDTNKNDKNVKKYIYISDLTTSVIAEVAEYYSVSTQSVAKKKEELANWLNEDNSGKRYLIKGKRRNLRATLMTWVRKDMNAGKIQKTLKTQLPDLPNLSSEQIQKNQEYLSQIRSKLVRRLDA